MRRVTMATIFEETARALSIPLAVLVCSVIHGHDPFHPVTSSSACEVCETACVRVFWAAMNGEAVGVSRVRCV